MTRAPEEKTLGQLNGWWAVAFKAFLVIQPVVLPYFIGFSAWATKSIMANNEFRERGDRFTQEEGEAIQRIIERHERTPHTGAVTREEFSQIVDWLRRVEQKLDRVIEGRGSGQ